MPGDKMEPRKRIPVEKAVTGCPECQSTEFKSMRMPSGVQLMICSGCGKRVTNKKET